jgi:hypothetical protein
MGEPRQAGPDDERINARRAPPRTLVPAGPSVPRTRAARAAPREGRSRRGEGGPGRTNRRGNQPSGAAGQIS